MSKKVFDTLCNGGTKCYSFIGEQFEDYENLVYVNMSSKDNKKLLAKYGLETYYHPYQLIDTKTGLLVHNAESKSSLVKFFKDRFEELYNNYIENHKSLYKKQAKDLENAKQKQQFDIQELIKELNIKL